MSTLSDALAIPDRDARDSALCAAIAITGPGAYALREADGRLMVWPSEPDADEDDGSRACFRSRAPITDAEWNAVCALAWVESFESA